jgi:hypothetical protein
VTPDEIAELDAVWAPIRQALRADKGLLGLALDADWDINDVVATCIGAMVTAVPSLDQAVVFEPTDC